MQVDFELLIVLNTAILFTIASLLVREHNPQMLFSLLSAVCWFTLRLGFVAAGATFPSYALLFLLIGILFTVKTIIMATDMLREKRIWR